jgi:2-oxoisovalerate dehydrogenase E1 component
MNAELADFFSPAMDVRLQRAYLIRSVEERLLQLFAAGKLSGTTHTCIGQELSAVALAEALDRDRDVIFSNHRCHGHYLAWTDDVEGLIAEVMGKSSGPCGGIGGSQHLCGRQFFSNGVQGGIVPVAAGIALGHKLARRGAITAVCIGDGTLGEGVLYETLNIAMRWGLPLLVLLENNGYAQSTAQTETLAGDICARAAAFGMSTVHANTWEFEQLATSLRRAADQVRATSVPVFVRVDTYRLAAHSKGDDDRDPAEIAKFSARDPLNAFLASSSGSAAVAAACAAVRARVERAVETAASERNPNPAPSVAASDDGPVALEPITFDSETQLAALNRALAEWLSADPRAVVLGEDIRSPYGGAFKVTRGLSDAHPERVLNSPISEAAIVGIGNGLALSGFRPIVEIMFGDFLSLCFDQLVNHAAKFVGMYNGRVTNPLLVRTPMGGGRGYGPTHSQNLEKHIAGIPGLTVLVLHGRTRIRAVFGALREHSGPVVMIENKLLYRERPDAPLPAGYAVRESRSAFPTTLLTPVAAPDLTLVAFGRMSVLAEAAVADLAETEEVFAELVLPLRVSPLDVAPILDSVCRTGKLLVVEEGAAGFDLGAEVIAAVAVAWRVARPLAVRRIAAQAVPIPSSPDLERNVLPQTADIRAACLELFDV